MSCARKSALACALLFVVGCGDDAPEGPPPDLAADVRALQRLVTEDVALDALDDVHDAVLDDRPVIAAEMLERGGLPAARRQVEAAEGVEVQTPEGRRFRRELARAYRSRVEALDRWREALARGVVEDLEIVEAMDGVRQADEAVLEIDRRLGAINPLPEQRSRSGRNDDHRSSGKSEPSGLSHPDPQDRQ